MQSQTNRCTLFGARILQAFCRKSASGVHSTIRRKVSLAQCTQHTKTQECHIVIMCETPTHQPTITTQNPTVPKTTLLSLVPLFCRVRRLRRRQSREPNARQQFLYAVFRWFMTAVCSVHTFTEMFLIAYDVHSLTMEELTVSIAYGIQHSLGLAKVYLL